MSPAISQLILQILTATQVTGEAQGDSGALDKFVQHLNMGPSAAKVSKVDRKEVSIKEGESGFTQ